jgi:hypothetical protein
MSAVGDFAKVFIDKMPYSLVDTCTVCYIATEDITMELAGSTEALISIYESTRYRTPQVQTGIFTEIGI